MSLTTDLFATSDSLGRVMLFHTGSLLVEHIWKGYRQAKVYFQDTSTLVLASPVRNIVEVWKIHPEIDRIFREVVKVRDMVGGVVMKADGSCVRALVHDTAKQIGQILEAMEDWSLQGFLDYKVVSEPETYLHMYTHALSKYPASSEVKDRLARIHLFMDLRVKDTPTVLLPLKHTPTGLLIQNTLINTSFPPPSPAETYSSDAFLGFVFEFRGMSARTQDCLFDALLFDMFSLQSISSTAKQAPKECFWGWLQRKPIGLLLESPSVSTPWLAYILNTFTRAEVETFCEGSTSAVCGLLVGLLVELSPQTISRLQHTVFLAIQLGLPSLSVVEVEDHFIDLLSGSSGVVFEPSLAARFPVHFSCPSFMSSLALALVQRRQQDTYMRLLQDTPSTHVVECMWASLSDLDVGLHSEILQVLEDPNHQEEHTSSPLEAWPPIPVFHPPPPRPLHPVSVSLHKTCLKHASSFPSFLTRSETHFVFSPNSLWSPPPNPDYLLRLEYISNLLKSSFSRSHTVVSMGVDDLGLEEEDVWSELCVALYMHAQDAQGESILGKIEAKLEEDEDEEEEEREKSSTGLLQKDSRRIEKGGVQVLYSQLLHISRIRVHLHCQDLSKTDLREVRASVSSGVVRWVLKKEDVLVMHCELACTRRLLNVLYRGMEVGKGRDRVVQMLLVCDALELKGTQVLTL